MERRKLNTGPANEPHKVNRKLCCLRKHGFITASEYVYNIFLIILYLQLTNKQTNSMEQSPS